MKKFFLVLGSAFLLYSSCDYKPRNQGKSLYNQHCQSCHMENGQGLGELYPPIQESDFVINHKDDLACLIRNGIEGKIIVNGIEYNSVMAGYPRLTEIEINNLVHYILVDLNGQEESFTVKDVKEQLENCAD